jgi:hypothetical protein
MTPSRVPPALVLLLVAVLLVAGCAQVGDGKRVTNGTPSVTMTMPATSPRDQPSVYWIRIDPVGNKTVGDVFTITSTTNLSAGEEILVQVYSSTFHPGGRAGKFSGSTGYTNVTTGKQWD